MMLSQPLFLCALPAILVFLLTMVVFWGWCQGWRQLYLVWPLFNYGVMAVAMVTNNFITTGALILFTAGGLFRFFSSWGSFKKDGRDLFIRVKSYFQSFCSWEKVLCVFTGLYLAGLFLRALIPDGHGDVYTYHLLGPKDWALFFSDTSFRPDYPNLFLCSIFEYLYYAYFLLFAKFLQGLISLPHDSYEFYLGSMQILAQILTSSLSYVFLPYLLFLSLKKFPYVRFLVILLIFGLRSFSWTWFMAKNDIVPFYFLLCAYTVRSRPYLASFLLGVALSAKFSNLWPCLFFLIWWGIRLIQNRQSSWWPLFRRPSFLVRCSLLFLLGIVPPFIRNAYYTGNPFFPVGQLGFSNIYYGKPHSDYVDSFAKRSSWTECKQKLTALWKKAYGLWALILVSFILGSFFTPLYFFLCTLVLTPITGPPIEWRLFSMLLFFLVLWFKELGPSFITDTTFPTPSRKREAAKIFLILVILGTSRFAPENFATAVRKLMNSTGSTLTALDEFPQVFKHNLKYYNRPAVEFRYSDYGYLKYYSRFMAQSSDLAKPIWIPSEAVAEPEWRPKPPPPPLPEKSIPPIPKSYFLNMP